MRLIDKALDHFAGKVAKKLAASEKFSADVACMTEIGLRYSPDFSSLMCKHIDLDTVSHKVASESFACQVADRVLQDPGFARKVGNYIEENLASSADFVNSVAQEIDTDDIAGVVKEYIDTDDIAEQVQIQVSEAFVRHMKRLSI